MNTHERLPLFKMAVAAAFEVIAFAIVGFLYNGREIFNPKTTFFSYTLFGLTTIILFNLLEFRSKKEFFAAACSISFLVVAIYFRSTTIFFVLRNILWFVIITAGVYVTHSILHHHLFRRNKFVSLTVWMGCCASYYFFMTACNLYVFNFYPQAFTVHFFLRSAAMGFSMGLGIGIGYEIFKQFGYRIAAHWAEKSEDISE